MLPYREFSQEELSIFSLIISDTTITTLSFDILPGFLKAMAVGLHNAPKTDRLSILKDMLRRTFTNGADLFKKITNHQEAPTQGDSSSLVDKTIEQEIGDTLSRHTAGPDSSHTTSSKASKLESAKSFLKKILSRSPTPVNTIKRAARQKNLCWRTIQRASNEVGVETIRENRCYYWKLLL